MSSQDSRERTSFFPRIDRARVKDALSRLFHSRYAPAALFFLLLALILLPRSCSGRTDGAENAPVPEPAASAEELETRLSGLLSRVSGVRTARVMIALADTGRTVYAEDVSEADADGRRTVDRKTVVAGGGAVRVTTLSPRPAGAVVVYTGTDSAAVRLALTSAVSSATGLGSDKITVLHGG